MQKIYEKNHIQQVATYKLLLSEDRAPLIIFKDAEEVFIVTLLDIFTCIE